LLSLPKIVLQRELIGIYWWVEYWHYFLTSILGFFLFKKFLKNGALFFAILFSLVFESLVVYSSFFLIPQTLVGLLTAGLLLEADEANTKFILLSSIAILLFHYIVGLVGVLIVAGYILAKRIQIRPGILNILIFLCTVLLIIALLANIFGSLQLLPREEAAHFNFSVVEKLNLLSRWYGILFFAFFPIGYFRILRENDNNLKLILIFSLILFSIVFLPFSYVLKFYVLARYFVHIVLSAGINMVMAKQGRLLKLISSGILLLSFLIVFIVNQKVYKEALHYGEFETQISYNEISAGEWLRKYSSRKNIFLVSDPSLSYILEAISGVNSQGGAFSDIKTRRVLSAINYSYNPRFIKQEILKIKDHLDENNQGKRETLFVVGGRYFRWQEFNQKEKESTFYNIWAPKIMSKEDKTYVDFLSKSNEFKLIYINPELAIFKVL
jgi:hypothetical protein